MIRQDTVCYPSVSSPKKRSLGKQGAPNPSCHTVVTQFTVRKQYADFFLARLRAFFETASIPLRMFFGTASTALRQVVEAQSNSSRTAVGGLSKISRTRVEGASNNSRTPIEEMPSV